MALNKNKSLIQKLNANNWEISKLDLYHSVRKFTQLYGHADFEYMSIAENESAHVWKSVDGHVTISCFRNKDVDRSAAAEGESLGTCEILVGGDLVFSFHEFLDPKAATGNADYNKEMVKVEKSDPWLLAMYMHAKNEMAKSQAKDTQGLVA